MMQALPDQVEISQEASRWVTTINQLVNQMGPTMKSRKDGCLFSHT